MKRKLAVILAFVVLALGLACIAQPPAPSRQTWELSENGKFVASMTVDAETIRQQLAGSSLLVDLAKLADPEANALGYTLKPRTGWAVRFGLYKKTGTTIEELAGILPAPVALEFRLPPGARKDNPKDFAILYPEDGGKSWKSWLPWQPEAEGGGMPVGISAVEKSEVKSGDKAGYLHVVITFKEWPAGDPIAIYIGD